MNGVFSSNIPWKLAAFEPMWARARVWRSSSFKDLQSMGLQKPRSQKKKLAIPETIQGLFNIRSPLVALGTSTNHPRCRRDPRDPRDPWAVPRQWGVSQRSTNMRPTWAMSFLGFIEFFLDQKHHSRIYVCIYIYIIYLVIYLLIFIYLFLFIFIYLSIIYIWVGI